MTEVVAKISNQLVGNMGLYYTCYELSKWGWNALPTSRNARGIAIVIYSQDAKRKDTIQVKSLTKRSPVPLGNKEDALYADFLIVCRNVATNHEFFITTPGKIKDSVHKGVKDGRISYWLELRSYERFKDNWDEIGNGFSI